MAHERVVAGAPTASLSVAVIVPALNEADVLPATLAQLQEQSPPKIVVVDGGSTDGTPALVRAAGVRLLESTPGRAVQMNAGAAATNADILLFLHADTRLPPRALDAMRAAIGTGRVWGRFDVRLDGERFAYRVIEWFMNRRSALTGIATGDQAIFVRRDVFARLGGYAPIALMEDIELSRRLKREGPPACLPGPVTASTRRWERHGLVRTVLRMWALRALYRVGVSPARLARWYG
jgi:rSAM/selenodomain-associated transferase 2